jgi:hypothetical protein
MRAQGTSKEPKEFKGSGSDLGAVGLVSNGASGLVSGIGTNSAFGTIGNSTYDPRQIAFHAIIQF